MIESRVKSIIKRCKKKSTVKVEKLFFKRLPSFDVDGVAWSGLLARGGACGAGGADGATLRQSNEMSLVFTSGFLEANIFIEKNSLKFNFLPSNLTFFLEINFFTLKLNSFPYSNTFSSSDSTIKRTDVK